MAQWSIVETKDVVKTIGKAQSRIVDEYEFWKAIVRISGPDALRALRAATAVPTVMGCGASADGKTDQYRRGFEAGPV